METGETVSQDQRRSDPRDQSDGQKMQGQCRQPGGSPDIQQQHDGRPPLSRLAPDVRRPGVSAELRPRVFPVQPFQKEDRKIDRTGKIGEQDQYDQGHRIPSRIQSGGALLSAKISFIARP